MPGKLQIVAVPASICNVVFLHAVISGLPHVYTNYSKSAVVNGKMLDLRLRSLAGSNIKNFHQDYLCLGSHCK